MKYRPGALVTKPKRVLVWFFAIVCVVGIYASFYGNATFWIVSARWLAHKSPLLYEVPTQLKDISRSQVSGDALSHFGYSFNTPLGEVDNGRVKTFPGVVILPFRSGPVISIRRMPADSFVQEVLKSGGSANNTKSLFGAETMSSDYLFTKAMLEASPSRVSLRSSEKDCLATSMLLLYKGTSTPTDSGLYFASVGDMKGFQYGSPERGRRVIVDLFAQDHGLEFIFFPSKNGPALQQADINAVIQSLHREAIADATAGN